MSKERKKKKIDLIITKNTTSKNKNSPINENIQVQSFVRNKLSVNTAITPSLIYYASNVPAGTSSVRILTEIKKSAIVNHVKKFKTFDSLTPFQRRVTSIAWHPVYANIVAVGSKGGELILKNFSNKDFYFCPGIGPGGSVVGLKCCAEDPNFVYTASITGKIRKEDFQGKKSRTLLSTDSCDNWFSALDACYKRNLILTADCSGRCYLITASGKKNLLSKNKFHKSKVTHCEFNACDPDLFVTSSIDNSVKIWDLRMVEDVNSKPKPLMEFLHKKGVNSAYFSPSNGLNLLTTDQHSEIKIFTSPCWTETLTIRHPHRKFQHLTSIKASWHPLEDIVVVGRYPDDNVFKDDERTIDFYDSLNGELLHRIKSPTGKIVSLNAFNISGDILASAAGMNLTFFKAAADFEGDRVRKQEENDSDSENIEVLSKRKKNATAACSRSAKKLNLAKFKKV